MDSESRCLETTDHNRTAAWDTQRRGINWEVRAGRPPADGAPDSCPDNVMVLSKGPIVQRRKPRHSQAESLTQGHSFNVEKSGTSSPARGLCLRVGTEAGEQDQGPELGTDIVGAEPSVPPAGGEG